MSLLRDLTLAAIYDFLAHRGEMVLESSTPLFEGIVKESLRVLGAAATEPLPLMERDKRLDRNMKKGFSHADGEEIAYLLESYMSSLIQGAGAGKFIETVHERVMDNSPLRATLKNSPVTESLALEVMRGDDKEEKVRTLPLLGEMQSEEAKLLLHDYLWDQDLDLRIAAVSAVAGMKSESSVPQLMRLLGDREMHMRLGAVNALARIRSKEAIDALIDVVLCDESEPVTARAIDALFDIGASPAADRLMEIAETHVDPARCTRAREAASKIRDRSRA